MDCSSHHQGHCGWLEHKKKKLACKKHFVCEMIRIREMMITAMEEHDCHKRQAMMDLALRHEVSLLKEKKHWLKKHSCELEHLAVCLSKEG